jgi:hypothetical protein
VGLIQERIHSRDFQDMSGFWTSAPSMGGVTLVFVLASVGLPGLGNFVGEFLVLVGTFHEHKLIAVAAATGLVFSVPYALRIMYRTFFGTLHGSPVQDLRTREGALLATMVAVIVWLGLFPNTVINTARPTVEAIEAGRKTVSAERPVEVSSHDTESQLTMKIPRGEFQAELSRESSYGGTGVSPVNDGQSRGTRDRPTDTGQSPEDRHSQAEPGNEKDVDFQVDRLDWPITTDHESPPELRAGVPSLEKGGTGGIFRWMTSSGGRRPGPGLRREDGGQGRPPHVGMEK